LQGKETSAGVAGGDPPGRGEGVVQERKSPFVSQGGLLVYKYKILFCSKIGGKKRKCFPMWRREGTSRPTLRTKASQKIKLQPTTYEEEEERGAVPRPKKG